MADFWWEQFFSLKKKIGTGSKHVIGSEVYTKKLIWWNWAPFP